MRALVRESLEEGAWGLSTGLDYPPGGYADTAELVEFHRKLPASAASITLTCATDWAIGSSIHSVKRSRSADAAGVPPHITHFYQSSVPAGAGLTRC